MVVLKRIQHECEYVGFVLSICWEDKDIVIYQQIEWIDDNEQSPYVLKYRQSKEISRTPWECTDDVCHEHLFVWVLKHSWSLAEYVTDDYWDELLAVKNNITRLAWTQRVRVLPLSKDEQDYMCTLGVALTCNEDG